MKPKILLWVGVVALVFFASSRNLSASPSEADSNTAQMKGGETRFALGLGASSDFVMDRGLKKNEKLSVNWYGGNIYFDPMDKFHLDFFLGAADVSLGSAHINNNETTIAELATDTTFAGGVGAKYDIADFEMWPDEPQAKLYASMGYRITSPDVSDATLGGERIPGNSNPTSSLSMNIELQEWHASLGISQRINGWWKGVSLMPYAGVQYSDVSMNLSGTGVFPGHFGQIESIRTGDVNSNDVVGVFVGLQVLSLGDRLALSVEGRFVDETAFSANGRFRW